MDLIQWVIRVFDILNSVVVIQEGLRVLNPLVLGQVLTVDYRHLLTLYL